MSASSKTTITRLSIAKGPYWSAASSILADAWSPERQKASRTSRFSLHEQLR